MSEEGHNTLARVVAAREVLEVGDIGYAATLLHELELDLAANVATSDPPTAQRSATLEDALHPTRRRHVRSTTGRGVAA